MTRGAVLLALLAASGCASSPQGIKQDALQAALQSGMTACDVIRADPSIPREPAVDAYCKRMVEGCAVAP